MKKIIIILSLLSLSSVSYAYWAENTIKPGGLDSYSTEVSSLTGDLIGIWFFIDKSCKPGLYHKMNIGQLIKKTGVKDLTVRLELKIDNNAPWIFDKLTYKLKDNKKQYMRLVSVNDKVVHQFMTGKKLTIMVNDKYDYYQLSSSGSKNSIGRALKSCRNFAK